jgi:hypothetical protein
MIGMGDEFGAFIMLTFHLSFYLEHSKLIISLSVALLFQSPFYSSFKASTYQSYSYVNFSLWVL